MLWCCRQVRQASPRPPVARHLDCNFPIASTGGIDDWNIRITSSIRTLAFDAARLPDALLACEGGTMGSKRHAGYDLANHNRPICANELQRARMERWRNEHPGYIVMAAKGREHCLRRRVQREHEEQAATAQ